MPIATAAKLETGCGHQTIEVRMTLTEITEIRPHSHLTLHYRLALANGANIINTFGERPATLLLGVGQLAAPLEAILLGLKPGHQSVFRLTPQQAFGERNPDLIQKVSMATLHEQGMMDEACTPGDWVEFSASDGKRYAGLLKAIDENYALFDFNHPLAGQTLMFEVQIIKIL